MPPVHVVPGRRLGSPLNDPRASSTARVLTYPNAKITVSPVTRPRLWAEHPNRCFAA